MKRSYLWMSPFYLYSSRVCLPLMRFPPILMMLGLPRLNLGRCCCFVSIVSWISIVVCFFLGFWSELMFVTSSACFNLLRNRNSLFARLSFCWLALKWNCSFVTILKLLLSFSLTFSDEIVTAAQHLYEMVSFYFDDLGKLLFVDVFCFGLVLWSMCQFCLLDLT